MRRYSSNLNIVEKMKFSLKAKSEGKVELIGVTPKSFFGMAIPIALKLEWEVACVTVDNLVFLTPFFFPTGGEKITITINNNEAIILSKNMGGFIPFELGKNTDNVSQFIEEYANMLDVTKVAEYEQRFDEALKMWQENAKQG